MSDPSTNANDHSAGATSLSLLERVKGKDTTAWKVLADLYTPLVRRWCRSWNLQEADIDDVLQEVFVSVERKIGTFQRDPSSGTFRGWLRTIAYRKTCDHWKHKGVVREHAVGGSDALQNLYQVPQPPPPSPEEDPQECGLLCRQAILLILSRFDASAAQAFWEVVIDNRSPADVAAELGLTTNAVYLAKARVLARLRQEFAHLIE